MNCVEKAAEELMVEPEDLFDIFGTVFSEIDDFFIKCEEALRVKDSIALAKLLHAKKGIFANLRMEVARTLVVEMEIHAKKSELNPISKLMGRLKEELERTRNEIEQYYAAKLTGPK